MHFKVVIQYVSALFFLLSSLQITHAQESHPVELSIKPLACIVKNYGDICKMTIKAKWQSAQAIDSCLLQGKRNLLCWKNKKSVSQHFNIELAENMTFSLTNTQGQVLAQQKIVVNSSLPKKFRRRLKAQWSLF
ncbi:DUF3019 domain-containing protein [Colwelliaceae bacterium 6441]